MRISGKELRLSRLFNSNGKTVILPFDHPITDGVLKGVEDPIKVSKLAIDLKTDAIIVRAGIIGLLPKYVYKNTSVICHVTARGTVQRGHYQLNSVAHALSSGADAICVEFKLGEENEKDNLESVSALIEESQRYSVPVMVASYATKKALSNEGDEAYRHAVRIAQELGADVIKTAIPSSKEIMKSCRDSVSVPIVLAGGVSSTSKFLENIEVGMDSGMNGVCAGRPIWGLELPDAIRVGEKVKSIVNRSI